MTPEEYIKQGRDEAVAAMLAALGYPFPTELHEALALHAENERLREALEKIAACKHVGTKAMQMVQTIARAALQSKGE